MSGRMICGANHSKDRRSKPWLIITQSSCSFSGSFRDMNSKPRPASTQRGQGLRVMSRWAQFVALGLAQLTGRQSLRNIVSNLSTQGRKLYHLGVGTTVSRSSLARVNAEQPYTLYETLFGRLLSRCRQCAPRHGFRFKNKLYAVDATTIDLCLAVFPWASFRRTKAAIKLHVGLDQAGHLPSFVSVTEGKTGDVKVARTWTFPRARSPRETNPPRVGGSSLLMEAPVVERGRTKRTWMLPPSACFLVHASHDPWRRQPGGLGVSDAKRLTELHGKREKSWAESLRTTRPLYPSDFRGVTPTLD